MPRPTVFLILLVLVLLMAPGLGTASAPGKALPSGSCMGLMVTVAPSNSSLAVGGSVDLSASVYCGNMGGMENVTSSSTISWSMGGNVGSLSTAGPQARFTASSNGSGTVEATGSYGGLTAQGSATMNVGGAPPPGGGNGSSCSMIMAVMTPSSADLAVGQSQDFLATVLCGSMGGMQDVTSQATTRWSGLAGLGTLSAVTGGTTSFQAVQPGNGTLWLTAEYGDHDAATSTFISVAPTSGASPRFWIHGDVTDPGGGVSGATVQALDLTTGGVVAGGSSGVTGNYTLALLAGPSYELRALSPSGESATSPPVTLTGNLTVNLALSGVPAPPSPGHGLASPWASGLLLLLAAAVLGTLVAVLFLGGELTQWALILPPLLLYARLKRDQILDHFVRGRIYGYIEGHPGVIYSEILRCLHLANGVASYHLYTLEREQFIVSRREGNLRRFYAPEASPRGGVDGLSGVQNDIVSLVRERPGIWQSEISRRLGVRRQNVNYNVTRLTRVGILSLEGWGWKKGCYAQERPIVDGKPCDLT